VSIIGLVIYCGYVLVVATAVIVHEIITEE